MMFKGMSWTSVISSLALYCIVFLAVRYDMFIQGAAAMQARPGLLMLTIPGAVAALTSKEAPLTVALLGALLGTPICLAIMRWYSMWGHDLLQELAFDASAIFWCGSGALAVMLLRTIFWHPHG
ncbi:inner membrane protein YbjM [Pantoea sp. BAV 3049]|uniref:inner membrane protein YbjM n=1 Tax=Pantoea sp. BAV 3049 TaxID=2654188 RepID=UPI001E2AD1B7|nr:inner membrane protein YbjM [Pantoea sp. BAV 3049]